MVAHAQAELKSLEKVITILALDSSCYPSGDPVADYEDGGPHFYLEDDPDNIVLTISDPFVDP